MSQQTHKSDNQPDKKHQSSVKPPVMPEIVDKFSDMFGTEDGGAIQAVQLNDARIPLVQRQMAASQIGDVQGNLHLLEVIKPRVGKQGVSNGQSDNITHDFSPSLGAKPISEVSSNIIQADRRDEIEQEIQGIEGEISSSGLSPTETAHLQERRNELWSELHQLEPNDTLSNIDNTHDISWSVDQSNGDSSNILWSTEPSEQPEERHNLPDGIMTEPIGRIMSFFERGDEIEQEIQGIEGEISSSGLSPTETAHLQERRNELWPELHQLDKLKLFVIEEIQNLPYYVTDFDRLTTIILEKLGNNQFSDVSAWWSLRGRIPGLLIAAEVALIRQKIPNTHLKGFKEDVWMQARTTYMNNIAKPIWLFYEQDIEGFSFLGKTVDKSKGIYRDAKTSLELVEQTIIEQQENGVEAEMPPVSSGFRFQPHLIPSRTSFSFHWSGRALDLLGTKNPMFKDPVQQLVSILGEEELYDLNISRERLREIASSPGLHQRFELEDRLKNSEEYHWPDREGPALNPTKKDIETFLNEINLVGEEATEIHDKLMKAEEVFKDRWETLTDGSNQAEDVNLETLYEQVNDALVKAEQELEDSIEKPKQKRQAIKAYRNRIKKLLDVITAPERLREELASDRKIKRADLALNKLLNQTAKLAETGFIEMPKWIVVGFTENGWSWGGSWRSTMDAMHFDYLGEIEGVESSY